MKRYRIVDIAIAIAVVGGLALVMMAVRQLQLPKRPGIALTARIIEDGIWDRLLRESVSDLSLLLDEYDRTGVQSLVDGYNREIKIASVSRRVFAMYERHQNDYGFDSALEVQPIVAEVLGVAFETVSKAVADERAPVALRKTNRQIASYFHQVTAGRPIKRAG